MSNLNQYTNKPLLLASQRSIIAERYSPADLERLDLQYFVSNFGTYNNNDVVELHAYDLNNTLLVSNHRIIDWNIENSIIYDDIPLVNINIHNQIRQFGIDRGIFRFNLNFNRNILGDYSGNKMVITNISSDRIYLKLKVVKPADIAIQDAIKSFKLYLDTSDNLDYYNDYILNFGRNDIYKIINLRYLESSLYKYGSIDYFRNLEVLVKLYRPLPEDFDINSKCWVAKTVSLPYFDTIELIPQSETLDYNILSGPNLDIESDGYQSITQTEFKNINNILGNDLDVNSGGDITDPNNPANQILNNNLSIGEQLISNYFSSSFFENNLSYESNTVGSTIDSAKLNINYNTFANFIHFSSAVERVNNFIYKLNYIEKIESKLAVVNTIQSASIGDNYVLLKKNKLSLINSLTGFERWLYYSNVDSLYSHAQVPQFGPYPKYTVSGSSYLYSTTESVSQIYIENLLVSASVFDKDNPHRLINTLPLHIHIDNNNSQFLLFVDMIGQHFDIIYAYINSLSKIYSREEHPADGVSSDLIFDIAKSFGWILSNGNQSKDLYYYNLGLNSTGSIIESQLGIKTGNDQTKEIWRRILNALPDILKSKGTTKSVRSLINAYGIPSTFLRIREYGGPGAYYNDVPTYEYDAFTYNLYFNGNTGNKFITSSFTELSNNELPHTVEFRIKNYLSSGSLDTLEANKFDYINYGRFNVVQGPIHIDLEQSGSNSEYGNIYFGSGSSTPILTDVLLFDGDWVNFSVNSNDLLYVTTKKWDNIVYYNSASITYPNYTGSLIFGQNFGLSVNAFTGSLSEIRYWSKLLNTESFKQHSLSYKSYIGNTNTSSYSDLEFRIKLDSLIDHATTSSIYSTHPNTTIDEFYNSYPKNILLSGFTEDDYDNSVDKLLTPVLSISDESLFPAKIRIEDITNPSSYLSPFKSNEYSEYDYKSIDSNRLDIHYSPQDIINDDIFYQLGNFSLDDYIGSFKYSEDHYYPKLAKLVNFYWQKYINKNDVSSFFILFSLFDFSVFDQIKQVLPARANPTLGLTIKPNVLERVRINIHRPIDVQDNLLNGNITQTDLTKLQIDYPDTDLYADPINMNDHINIEQVFIPIYDANIRLIKTISITDKTLHTIISPFQFFNKKVYCNYKYVLNVDYTDYSNFYIKTSGSANECTPIMKVVTPSKNTCATTKRIRSTIISKRLNGERILNDWYANTFITASFVTSSDYVYDFDTTSTGSIMTFASTSVPSYIDLYTRKYSSSNIEYQFSSLDYLSFYNYENFIDLNSNTFGAPVRLSVDENYTGPGKIKPFGVYFKPDTFKGGEYEILDINIYAILTTSGGHPVIPYVTFTPYVSTTIHETTKYTASVDYNGLYNINNATNNTRDAFSILKNVSKIHSSNVYDDSDTLPNSGKVIYRIYSGQPNNTFGMNFDTIGFSNGLYLWLEFNVSNDGVSHINIHGFQIEILYKSEGKHVEYSCYTPGGLYNSKYAGVKMSSLAINTPSQDTYDKEPVIEAFYSTKNQDIYNSDLTVRAGGSTEIVKPVILPPAFNDVVNSFGQNTFVSPNITDLDVTNTAQPNVPNSTLQIINSSISVIDNNNNLNLNNK